MARWTGVAGTATASIMDELKRRQAEQAAERERQRKAMEMRNMFKALGLNVPEGNITADTAIPIVNYQLNQRTKTENLGSAQNTYQALTGNPTPAGITNPSDFGTLGSLQYQEKKKNEDEQKSNAGFISIVGIYDPERATTLQKTGIIYTPQQQNTALQVIEDKVGIAKVNNDIKSMYPDYPPNGFTTIAGVNNWVRKKQDAVNFQQSKDLYGNRTENAPIPYGEIEKQLAGEFINIIPQMNKMLDFNGTKYTNPINVYNDLSPADQQAWNSRKQVLMGQTRGSMSGTSSAPVPTQPAAGGSMPEGAVYVGTNKRTGKPAYRLPNGTYWSE